MKEIIKGGESRDFALMLAPALIVIIILGIVPVGSILVTSMLNWEITNLSQPSFVWFQNFIDMAKDRRFLGSVKVQLIMSLGSVSIQLILGLVFGIIFQKVKGFVKIFRSVMVIPFVMPPVVVALTWLTLFTPTISPINSVIESFGIAGPQWLTVGWLAILSLIIADSWASFPFSAILILSALQNVSEELYEAAEIDGANKWQQIKYITLPSISWSIILCAVLRIIESFKAFPLIFVLTGGGPGTATEVTNFYAYLSAFQYGHLGYASALSFTMFAVTVILSTFIIRSSRDNLYR